VESFLVYDLRTVLWISQTNGIFVSLANALVELLLEGFLYDIGNEGLKVIHFGVEVVR